MKITPGDAKPYPTPLEYHPDDGWGPGEIRHGGAVVAHVLGVDDFPCLGLHGADGGAIQQEIDATGRELAHRYNTQPELLAALKALATVTPPVPADAEDCQCVEVLVTVGQIRAALAVIAKAEPQEPIR